MAEEAKKKRKSRPRPVRGINISFWSANGGPIPESLIAEVESAIEGITLVAFNDGHRILTQTTRG